MEEPTRKTENQAFHIPANEGKKDKKNFNNKKYNNNEKNRT